MVSGIHEKYHGRKPWMKTVKVDISETTGPIGLKFCMQVCFRA